MKIRAACAAIILLLLALSASSVVAAASVGRGYPAPPSSDGGRGFARPTTASRASMDTTRVCLAQAADTAAAPTKTTNNVLYTRTTVVRDGAIEAVRDGVIEKSPEVTLELNDAPVLEAIKSAAKACGISYAIRGDLPKDLRVTVSLHNATPSSALQLLCAAANLQVEPLAGGESVIISARPVATVLGQQVPLVGAIDQTVLAQELKGYSVKAASATFASSASAPPAPFAGSANLVDLEVREVSFREAIAQLSTSSGVSIVVDKSVPEGMIVTARVHSVTLQSALAMFLDQAHLTYAASQTPDGRPEVRIVPVPEVHVELSNLRPGGSEVVAELPLIWRAQADREGRGIAERWYAPNLDDSAWSTVSTTRMWFQQAGPLNGLRGAYAWGRVEFPVDRKWRDRRVILRIVSIDEDGTVYLNGEQIAGPGAVAGGWDKPLDIDVTGKLRFDRPNVLAVRICAVSTLGGVYRPVMLYATGK